VEVAKNGDAHENDSGFAALSRVSADLAECPT
jgi:hypothetical protein